MALEQVRVRSVKKSADPDKGYQVIVSENHPEHEGGSVFIVTDGKTHTVAKTPRIATLLGEGVLKQRDATGDEKEVPPKK